MNPGALGVRIRRATWLVATIGLASLLLAAPAHAAVPGKNGRIAFNGNGIETIKSDGSDRQVLTMGFNAAWSPDGTKIAFDGCESGPCGIYVANSDGTGATLVATPPSGIGGLDDPTWSPDGKRIAMVRAGPCYTSGCAQSDLYVVNSDGTGFTNLTPLNNGLDEAGPAWSPDGSKIAFWTRCDLEPPPENCATAIYTVRADGGGVSLITAGTSPEWSPSAAKIAFDYGSDLYTMNADGTGRTPLTSYSGYPSLFVNSFSESGWSPDGSKIAFSRESCTSNPCTSDLIVMNSDGTSQTDIASTSGSADWQPLPINYYPRPKGATPFQTYLTVAYKPCTSANEQHGAPLSSDSCSPPQQASDYLTVGTLDSNGQKANSVGSVRYDVKLGSPSTPADVKIAVSILDVRQKSDLSDYTGELLATATRRITDKDNTPAPGAATVTDIPFSATVPCASTSDTTIGSTCLLSTTANAIIAGQVKENMRSIWQLDQVQVYDGGADDQASTTADNTLFMDEGIFAP